MSPTALSQPTVRAEEVPPLPAYPFTLQNERYRRLAELVVEATCAYYGLDQASLSRTNIPSPLVQEARGVADRLLEREVGLCPDERATALGITGTALAAARLAHERVLSDTASDTHEAAARVQARRQAWEALTGVRRLYARLERAERNAALRAIAPDAFAAASCSSVSMRPCDARIQTGTPRARPCAAGDGVHRPVASPNNRHAHRQGVLSPR